MPLRTHSGDIASRKSYCSAVDGQIAGLAFTNEVLPDRWVHHPQSLAHPLRNIDPLQRLDATKPTGKFAHDENIGHHQALPRRIVLSHTAPGESLMCRSRPP